MKVKKKLRRRTLINACIDVPECNGLNAPCVTNQHFVWIQCTKGVRHTADRWSGLFNALLSCMEEIWTKLLNQKSLPLKQTFWRWIPPSWSFPRDIGNGEPISSVCAMIKKQVREFALNVICRHCKPKVVHLKKRISAESKNHYLGFLRTCLLAILYCAGHCGHLKASTKTMIILDIHKGRLFVRWTSMIPWCSIKGQKCCH